MGSQSTPGNTNNPKAFRRAPSNNAADLWQSLTKIIDTRLGKKSDTSRAKGKLTPDKRRQVAFLDAGERLLDSLGLNLRLRSDLDDDGKAKGSPEITLKFRSPDILLTAEYRRIATAERTILEEDIAPLQIKRSGKAMATPKPRSFYSRFAVSTKLDADVRFKTVKDLFEPFGWLQSWLGRSTTKKQVSMNLRSGPNICEWIFEDTSVDLGDGVEGEFTLTLWYLHRRGTFNRVFKEAVSGKLEPRIAEISFDFKTPGGQMPAAAAERAATLFKAMQEELDVDRKETSKTRLGLP